LMLGRPVQKFCSRECWLLVKRRTSREHMARVYARVRLNRIVQRKAHPRYCAVCGARLPPTKRSHAQVCGPRCAAKWKRRKPMPTSTSGAKA
jgi:predicted nucleic acid-binding Zn ribbon protein